MLCHFEFAGVFMMMKVLSTDYELHFASPVFILLQVLLHCYLWFVMEFENQHIPVYVGKLCVFQVICKLRLCFFRIYLIHRHVLYIGWCTVTFEFLQVSITWMMMLSTDYELILLLFYFFRCCFSVAHGLHRFGLCMINLMLGPVDGQLDFESSLLNQWWCGWPNYRSWVTPVSRLCCSSHAI